MRKIALTLALSTIFILGVSACNKKDSDCKKQSEATQADQDAKDKEWLKNAYRHGNDHVPAREFQ